MNYKTKKEAIKNWLNHPGWDIIKEELTQEIELKTKKVINGEVELRFEVKAIQSLLDKLENYNG